MPKRIMRIVTKRLIGSSPNTKDIIAPVKILDAFELMDKMYPGSHYAMITEQKAGISRAIKIFLFESKACETAALKARPLSMIFSL